MVLPEALAIAEIVPSNLRAIGLLPFIYILPALGFLLLVRFAGRIWQAAPFGGGRMRLAVSGLMRKRPALWAFSLILVLLVGGVTTGRTYFEDWATRADVFYESDGDLVAVSEYLDTADLAGKSAYVAALHYRHPTVAFLSERYDQLRWLPEGRALVIRNDEPALYIYPHNSPPPEWATGFLPPEPVVEGPIGPDGRPTFVAYELTQPPDLSPASVVNANFADQGTLVGYEIGALDSGERLPLTLYWQVQRSPAGNLTPFVHIEDAWGYRWGQVESFAYPAEQWRPGDVIIQRVEAPLSTGMPPGYYDLRVGIFDADNGQQLSLLDEGGRYAGNALTIEETPIFLTWPTEDPPLPDNVLDRQVNSNLRLLGYERAEQKVAAGAPFWLSLWWAADGPLEPMYTRLSLIGANNTGRIVLDTPPVRGMFPFETWTAPTVVIDHMAPSVPADLPPGDYIVAM